MDSVVTVVLALGGIVLTVAMHSAASRFPRLVFLGYAAASFLFSLAIRWVLQNPDVTSPEVRMTLSGLLGLLLAAAVLFVAQSVRGILPPKAPIQHRHVHWKWWPWSGASILEKMELRAALKNSEERVAILEGRLAAGIGKEAAVAPRPDSSAEEQHDECPIALKWAERSGQELTVYLFHEETDPLKKVQVELGELALVKQGRPYPVDLPSRVILGGGERLFAHHFAEGRRRFEVARRQGDQFRLSSTKTGGEFGHVARKEKGEWRLTYSVTLEGIFCGQRVLRISWDGSTLRAVEPE